VEARWSPTWSGDVLRLLIHPDEIVPALRRLLELQATDVAVEEAGLDEAFLAFYRQAEAQARRPKAPAWGTGPPADRTEGGL
jgi:ABC-2 type transport system ATP-binding protein